MHVKALPFGVRATMGEEVMVPGSIETKLGVTAKGEAWRLITPLRLIRNTNEYNASSARSLGI